VNKPGRLLDAVRAWLWRLEDLLMLLLLLGMIALACLQIFLRNAFDIGWLWADPVLRVLLLWSALFGAMAASRHDKHISIDVFSRWLPPLPRMLSKLVSCLFTAGICGIAAYYAGWFVLDEYRYSTADIGGVRIWWFETLMPFAFAVMGLRFAVHAARAARKPSEDAAP
jgi:TRAP-type C4-dicarboxylate transport system permease small subunit